MSTDPIADGWLGRIALTRRSNSDLRGRVSCSIMTASPVLGGALCHAPGCWSTHRVDTSWSDVGTASLRRWRASAAVVPDQLARCWRTARPYDRSRPRSTRCRMNRSRLTSAGVQPCPAGRRPAM